MSVISKTLIQLDELTVINPREVTTMEYVKDFGASYWSGDKGKFGTIISFNSGRKVFIASKTPSEITQLLVCEDK